MIYSKLSIPEGSLVEKVEETVGDTATLAETLILGGHEEVHVQEVPTLHWTLLQSDTRPPFV